MAHNKSAADLPREQWHTWDPMLLSGLYAIVYLGEMVVTPENRSRFD